MPQAPTRPSLTLVAATLAALSLPSLNPGTALAQGPVKIGLLTTLSTNAGYLGEDARDGFLLAVEMGKGSLGGVPVEVIVEDDERKPERGVQASEKLVKADKVEIMTGGIFSNVAMAVVPKVVRDDVFYISPNAGPSALAGKGCHANYFNVAYQNDNQHEAMGQYAQDAGFKSVYLLAPNYPAGKDSLTGFKRFYNGTVAGETYTKLGQSDYAAEIAAIRDAKPDAVFYFLPGGMGINFLKQFNQAGLTKDIQVLGPGFSFDERLLGAVGDAAIGARDSSQWNHDMDNAANKAFTAAFTAKYNRPITQYAAMGYDAAQLIGSALKATGGKVSEDRDGFRSALEKADFASVRGDFTFGPNHHPIQSFWLREVVKAEDGTVTNKIAGKIFDEHQDAYAADCKM
ncbi:ABC transporter substrate-binding protein [Rhodospirillum sp. A1_3_36]|uniref:ABC transporter substrate-binding protein n=1 Tax=Rhodospirillum sp. A1_3_36 TaxID=3391666 RepID=UPI0039A410EE